MDNIDDKERTPAEKKDSHYDANLVFSDHSYGDIVCEIMNSYTPRYWIPILWIFWKFLTVIVALCSSIRLWDSWKIISTSKFDFFNKIRDSPHALNCLIHQKSTKSWLDIILLHLPIIPKSTCLAFGSNHDNLVHTCLGAMLGCLVKSAWLVPRRPSQPPWQPIGPCGCDVFSHFFWQKRNIFALRRCRKGL